MHKENLVKQVDGSWCVMSRDGQTVLFRAKTQEQAINWKSIHLKGSNGAEPKHIHVRGAIGEIRTATFENKEYLVAPVVAMVEGVVHAVNAAGPELVLSEELGLAPAGWNGRPVMMNHPKSGGRLVSANDPRILEKFSFGTTFNTQFKKKRLSMEAWMDPVKAEKVDGALDTIQRIRDGELVEVSVGVFVTTEEETGTYEGKKYVGVWRDLVPDHLALLPSGAIGACDAEMGCGTPRTATVHVINSTGGFKYIGLEENQMSDDKKKKTLRDRILEKFGFVVNQQELSDIDLRRMLHKVLMSTEPGFMDIEAVFPSESLVIYGVSIPDEDFTMYRRSYSLQDSEIVLADDREEVKPITKWEPASAESASSDCGCGSEEKDVKMNERVKALIENENTVWTAADSDYLSKLDENRLKELEEHANLYVKKEEVKSTPPENKSQNPEKKDDNKDSVAAAESKPKTEEEWLKEAPESVRSIVTSAKRSEQQKRDTLIASLKDSQKAYTEEELKTLNTEHLEKLASITVKETKSVDYSGNGGLRSSSVEDDKVPDPPNYIERIRAAQTAN